ncbi:MAG TPA: aminotransferase class V-fold PLP-dependent enzyme [Acidimicrobiales bacterium]|nr:aminotransferase class V-fold PLP-dependent enzyme [Acidimicrobiales bacterium]
MTGIDVDRARDLTPGAAEVLHLNHAGASLLPQPVLDTVIAHLHREATTGGYEAAAEAAEALAAVYDSVAALLGCGPDEIALTDSATRGWASVVHSLPLRPGERVITGRAEYGSNAIALLQLQRRTGCELVLVDDDEHGQIDLDALAQALDHDHVGFVSLVHVPTQSGLVNPAAEVGRLCRGAEVLFVLDACQSAGQLPLDVAELGCHVLTATGRKFLRGPRGTGFAYVDRHLVQHLEPPMLDLLAATWVAPERYEIRPDARRFEMWEADIAGRLGLGAAVDHALSWGLDAIAARNATLAAGLRDRLSAIPGVTVRDRGARLCAITTFTIDGLEPEDVVARLRAQGTNVTASTATSAQLDLPHRGLRAVVRASVHYLTTDEELDRFAAQVAGLSRATP